MTGTSIERVNADGVEHSPAAILDRMETELKSAASAAIEAWPGIREQAREIPDGPTEAVVLTGCGDSYYAAIAIRPLLEASAGVPVLAQPAMEVVAFPSALMTRRALTVGISVSGKVERTIQALTEHRKRGGTTVSISAYGDSDLGASSHAAIATGMRGTPGPVPGTANFLGSLLGLVGVAVELGERRGLTLLDDGAITQALAAVAEVVRNGGPMAKHVATGLEPPFFAIGTGPDLGPAWYGVAKFLEAAATVGVAQDLEEWAHEQFFTTGPDTTVFVHASSPVARDRARRVAGSAVQVGARVVSVTAAPLGIAGEQHWAMPALHEGLMPLVTWAPMAWSALAYARHAGRHPFGIDLPGRMQTVDEDIYLDEPRRP